VSLHYGCIIFFSVGGSSPALSSRERSSDESRGFPTVGSTEFLTLRDGEETDDEILLGDNMAYGAFSEERDAWNSPDTYTTSKK